MPFYVSPEQAMKDKADYARKGIARGRSGVVIQYDAGILFVAPNPSRALHKISEIYDRIAFAAVGRYNEYEILRKAGVRYADMTGYQYDRQDVTARGLANWYAQTLGTIFTDSPKPFEVEIVVAEVAEVAAENQIYRITFDGSVAEEHGFVAMGGQADQIAAVLKARYADDLTIAGALDVAIAGLAAQANGDRPEITASQLEVAVLDRARTHRTFRRVTGARLADLLAEIAPRKPGETTPGDAESAAAPSAAAPSAAAPSAAATPSGPAQTSAPQTGTAAKTAGRKSGSAAGRGSATGSEATGSGTGSDSASPAGNGSDSETGGRPDQAGPAGTDGGQTH
jgi:proteasome alpha subunit